MCGSIQLMCYHPYPRAYPEDLTVFFLFDDLFPSPGHEKETIPHPQDSYLPKVCLQCMQVKGWEYWLY